LKIRRYRCAFLGTILFTLATSAHAQLTGNLLLRQGSFGGRGYVNQNFTDLAAQSTGMGSMVTTTATWNVSNIQTLQLQGGAVNNWWGNVNSATLNVTRQAGGLPDPAVNPTISTNSGPSVVFSGIVGVVLDQGTATANGPNQAFRMTADTSGIAALQGLAAGNYVFSLVANTTFAVHGQTFTAQSIVAGATNDYTRNPGGGFNLGGPGNTNWVTMTTAYQPSGPNANWAIGINGSAVPEPASMAALGLGTLAMVRRRRSKKA
jgi:hypothetical protein